MSINFSKRRSSSIVPEVKAFNNWLNTQQFKVSAIKARATRNMSKSFYRSTIPVNPEGNSFFETQKSSLHNRTFSSHRNTQSRLNITMDGLAQISDEIMYHTQRAKKTRLDIKMMKKQSLIDLQRKEQFLRQKIAGLKKLVNYSISDQQARKTSIKNQVSQLKGDYRMMREKIDWISDRLSYVENQCGFVNVSSQFYK